MNLMEQWRAVVFTVLVVAAGAGWAAGAASFSNTPAATAQTSGVPAVVVPREGLDQTALTGTTLPVAPMVRVADAAGNPVPNVPVHFRVVDGGGTITGADAITDARGRARVGSWTLGPSRGRQHLGASTPGLPEAVISAYALVEGARLDAVDSTDRQMAPLGSALARAPSVQVLDADNRPVPGVTVNFAAGQGGSLERGSNVSNAQGVASPGAWTLGPVEGEQTLTASAEGFTTVRMDATALPAGAPALVRDVFMRNVFEVWDIQFAPGGVMLYSERGRGLKVRMPGGATRTLFAPPDLISASNSGMLGIALDPNFASNRRLYVYMASSAGGVPNNHVVRLRIKPDWTGVDSRKDIVTGIPFQTKRFQRGQHSGGALAFDAGGYLLVSTGDNLTGPIPQSLRSLGGKVLRVDTEGRPAPDNQAPTAADPRIWVRGLRNPQGLAIQPGTGRAYLIEHGPFNNDEVTPLQAGNGGWDPRPRPLGSPDARCPNGVQLSYCGDDGGTDMTDTALYPDALRPAWRSGTPALGTAGGGFVNAAAWKDWRGALVLGQLSGRRLLVLQLTANGNAVRSATPLLQQLGVRLRTVAQGPDGALYVATSSEHNVNDVRTEIWRLRPQ
jgi:glucose/arabinose dehydrogenase